MFCSRLILAVSLAALLGPALAQQTGDPAAAPAAAASAAGVQTFAIPSPPEPQAAPVTPEPAASAASAVQAAPVPAAAPAAAAMPATPADAGPPPTAAARSLAPIAPQIPPTAPALLPLPNMRLPPGFKAEIWASGIADARSLRLGDKGTVFVGTALDPGAVYAVVDKGDHREIRPVVSQLQVPNGIEFLGGSLYVATTEALLRYDSIESRLDDPPAPVVLGGLPPSEVHRARYLRFGPDGKLYISVGAPCNVCEPGAEYAKIMRMNRDGSGVETVASGVRNSMGLDFDPRTGDLWFTDNGRDWLSENLPNDTLAHLAKRGQDFGFPYCDQGDLPDPIYGWGRDCSQFAQPAQLLGPHAAPLGLRFYNGAMFPARYKGAMFIARHGPWNRTRKFGADIVAVWPNAAGGVAKMEPFMSGWVENNRYLGRPVDLLVLGDGSLLVSDDYNGAVYRISYAGT